MSSPTEYEADVKGSDAVVTEAIVVEVSDTTASGSSNSNSNVSASVEAEAEPRSRTPTNNNVASNVVLPISSSPSPLNNHTQSSAVSSSVSTNGAQNVATPVSSRTKSVAVPFGTPTAVPVVSTSTSTSSPHSISNITKDDLISLVKKMQKKINRLEESQQNNNKDISTSNASINKDMKKLRKEKDDLENKLISSNAQLIKTFNLLTTEKKNNEEKSELILNYQNKYEALRNEYQIMLKTNTASNIEKQSIIDGLKRELMITTDRYKKLENDTDDINTLRQELQSRTIELSTLQDEIEHDRIVRERERNQLENENELLREEVEQEKAAKEHEMARMEREQKEAEDRFINEIAQLNTKLRQGAKTYHKVVNEFNETKQALEKCRAELKEMETIQERDKEKLKKIEDDFNVHKQHFESLGSERYERLLSENRHYKESMNKELKQSKEVLVLAEARIKELEAEMNTGKPSERRIFEIAEYQARREETIRTLQSENRAFRGKLDTLRNKLRALKEERAYYASQIAQFQRSQSRSVVNLDYLKSIMVRLLCLDSSNPQYRMLVPVIETILEFSPDEKKRVESWLSNNNSSMWSKMFGGPTAADTSLDDLPTLPAHFLLNPSSSSSNLLAPSAFPKPNPELKTSDPISSDEDL